MVADFAHLFYPNKLASSRVGGHVPLLVRARARLEQISGKNRSRHKEKTNFLPLHKEANRKIGCNLDNFSEGGFLLPSRARAEQRPSKNRPCPKGKNIFFATPRAHQRQN